MLLGGFRVDSEKWAVLCSLLWGSLLMEGWPGSGPRVHRGRAERAAPFQGITTSVTEFVWPEICQRCSVLLPGEGEGRNFFKGMGTRVSVLFPVHSSAETNHKTWSSKAILGMKKFKRGDFRNPTSGMWAAGLLQLQNQK